MSLDMLFDNFEMVADAPKGVPKLRELILQMAVQGKLVPQDPTDEQASVFLDKIKAEKEWLIKEKRIKKSKPLPLIASDEIPYELPERWTWTRLGNIQDFVNGYAFKSKDYQDSGIGIVRIGDIVNGNISHLNMKYIPSSISKSLDKRLFVNYGDLLIAMSGATTGKLGFNITDSTFVLNQRVGKLNTIKVDRKYVFFYLSTKIKENLKISAGSAIPNLSTQQINETIFPLPPLNEQRRIVAKVDQLMVICDELEARKQKRDKTGIALNDAALDRLLSAQKQKDFTKHWDRISNNFDLLYDNPENVNKLRQAILQLAVQGKLVPQDPNDEPASVLLEKITAERDRLIKEKKIKRTKPLPPITPGEIPYKLPDGWEWVRLEECVNLISGQHIKSRNYNTTSEGVPYLTGPIDFGKINPVIAKWTNKPKVLAIKDDILLTVKGAGLGKNNIVDTDVIAISRQLMAIRCICINYNFMHNFIVSKYDYFQSRGVGIAIPGIGRKDVLELCLPLPPLKEQKRIVAKVHQLMVLCDELESKLSQSQSDCDELLNAILNNIEKTEKFVVTKIN